MVRRRYRRFILWSGEDTEGLFHGQDSGEGTEGLFYGQVKVQKTYFMGRRRYRRFILWSGEDTEGLFYGLEKVEKAYFLISKPVLSGTFYLIIFRQSADSSAKKVPKVCTMYDTKVFSESNNVLISNLWYKIS